MRALYAGLMLLAVAAGCTKPSLGFDGPDSPQSNATTENRPIAEEEAAEPFAVGDRAPAFENLEGTDDERHSLKDFDDAKAVVIAFICNHCPVAVAYEDRLNALQKDYADKGVRLVAINVNNLEADKLPAMKKRAEEKGFQFPYLYDPSQQVGRDYGAIVTPHVFLLDSERRLAYVGPIDDSQDEANVTTQYLRDAIDATLAGQQPETTNVTPFGCSIKYE
jgi:peroxiredoxin